MLAIEYVFKNWYQFNLLMLAGLSFLVQWTIDKEMHYPSFTDETIIINGKSGNNFDEQSKGNPYVF